MNKFNFLLLLIIIVLTACSKDEKEVSLIKETSQELEMISSYNEAYKSLREGDPFFAAKKFLEAELLYPQSTWAPKASLMASYSYYMQNYYTEATLNLERYLKTYPNDKNLPYAHYLIAMCYYESIEDEKKDLGPLLDAQSKFNFIIKEYPNTEFSMDSKFKLDLIEDILASKEMYIGRHYIKKGKWIAAIKRFNNVLSDYDETIFVDEALHRLVELNFKLGLTEESKKYAALLGYNYQSSEWYEKSYSIFNEDYSIKPKKIIQKDKKNVLEKFRKFFE